MHYASWQGKTTNLVGLPSSRCGLLLVCWCRCSIVLLLLLVILVPLLPLCQVLLLLLRCHAACDVCSARAWVCTRLYKINAGTTQVLLVKKGVPSFCMIAH